MRIEELRVCCCGHNNTRLLLEILSAKEAKRRSDCSGKHLGCPGFPGVSEGLQYGLSGNRATGESFLLSGDNPDMALKGNRLTGNGR